MDERERTYLSRDERHAQLVAVGLQLFSTRSYDEVAIEEIAAAAGVSKGLLYHYFTSKRGLYAAVVEYASGELLSALLPSPDVEGVDNARRGIRAYLLFVSERADAFLALMSGSLGTDPQVQAVLERTREAIVAQILYSAGLDATVPTARICARAWLGSVESASLDWLRHRDADIETLVDIFGATLYIHLLAAARFGGAPTSPLTEGLPLLMGLVRGR